jgi:protein-arginine kinase activator protein McsA
LFRGASISTRHVTAIDRPNFCTISIRNVSGFDDAAVARMQANAGSAAAHATYQGWLKKVPPEQAAKAEAALPGSAGGAGRRDSPLAAQARHDGGRCGKCGRTLEPTEPVWLYRSYYGGPLPIVPYCATCAPRSELPGVADAPAVKYRTYTCATCGRPIHREARARQPKQRAFCSERCAWRWRNAQRDEVAAQHRHKTCTACGAPFQATRRDATTCTAACRQKLYRGRVSDDKLEHRGVAIAEAPSDLDY